MNSPPCPARQFRTGCGRSTNSPRSWINSPPANPKRRSNAAPCSDAPLKPDPWPAALTQRAVWTRSQSGEYPGNPPPGIASETARDSGFLSADRLLLSGRAACRSHFSGQGSTICRAGVSWSPPPGIADFGRSRGLVMSAALHVFFLFLRAAGIACRTPYARNRLHSLSTLSPLPTPNQSPMKGSNFTGRQKKNGA